MAEDKNGVIIYADWIDKFEELADDEAGRLIKHFCGICWNKIKGE